MISNIYSSDGLNGCFWYRLAAAMEPTRKEMAPLASAEHALSRKPHYSTECLSPGARKTFFNTFNDLAAGRLSKHFTLM